MKPTKLFQPSLVDFSECDKHATATVEIKTLPHKFAKDAAKSGTDPKHMPIFGSIAHLNGKLVSEISFGLPFFRFKRGQKPRIKFINKTGYTFNLHLHGLNIPGDADGADGKVVFGVGTKIGVEFDLYLPTINNNSTLLWIHAHPMFTEVGFVYTGLAGLLDIVDDVSKSVTDEFQYGDNRILLKYQDIDLEKDGTYTLANTLTDENRSSFGLINGISCINWYSSSKSKPFFETLYHKVSKNLVKIDILNGTGNWRYLYLGVSDNDGKIMPFYQIQSDTGLMNPIPLTMISLAPANRVAILFDTSEFSDGVAHLFAYNFDLTEIFGATPAFPEKPNNPSLVSPVPDLSKSSNPTPYPTPIPDPNQENQQGDFTLLTYPIVPLIPQVSQLLENGSIIPPQDSGLPFSKKPFLKILKRKCDKDIDNTISLKDMIKRIQKVVFGEENYKEFKNLITKKNFEYLPGVNYLDLLNKNYFYNLPKFSSDVPVRNFILFGDDDENSIPPYGSTEYCDGANRVFADMWNSEELDFNYALDQYNLAPNNFKPSILPTCLFSITKPSRKYSNIDMDANNKLTVEFFKEPIVYGDTTTTSPVASTTIIFPSTPSLAPLNINKWIDLVNSEFEKTQVFFPKKSAKSLSDLLDLDWTFYPFKIAAVYQKVWYIKSVMMKTNNKSKYYVRLKGRWPLLQFLGKSMNAGSAIGESCGSSKRKFLKSGKKEDVKTKKTINMDKSDKKGKNDMNLDMNIQMIYPLYATSDPEVQIPIINTDQNAELIIAPRTIFNGFIDGYANDNFKAFSVQLDSNEQWVYHNADDTDAHPFHFHLTSGYANLSSPYTSPGLLSVNRGYASYLYSRENYGIGPQQSIGFNLTFPNYSSFDTSPSPDIPGIGFMYHCHLLPHVSSVNMSNFFLVYPGDRSILF